MTFFEKEAATWGVAAQDKASVLEDYTRSSTPKHGRPTADFGETARELLENGYHVVPIKPGHKRPPIDGWQNARLTAADIDRFPRHGWGILCGVGEHPICAIDIDVRHEGVAQAIENWCLNHLGFAPERVGQAPKRLLVYRAAEPGWKKMASAWFADSERPDEKLHRVEVLGKGQQFVAYHVHPDTGKPYEWVDLLGGLECIPASDLCVVTREQIARLLPAAERIAEAYGLVRVGPSPAVPTAVFPTLAEQQQVEHPIPVGARNETLFRLAASLRAKGLTVEAIEAALLAENALKCDPPLPEDEVRTIAKSVGRYPEGSTTGGRCAYAGGEFIVSDRGVEYIGLGKDGEPLPPLWICSPLRVVASTRDTKGAEWGRLLEWHDGDGRLHRWAMPMELLQGDGVEVRRELARLGVHISPGKKARDLLGAFLQVWPVEARARCVDRLGWHGDLFVLPDEAIGQSDEIVVFQNAHAIEPAYSVAGSVEEWRESVARLAAGNSRLVFALSVAFAGALAAVAGEESGGFHLRGASSTGKTTALKVAASVWGHPTSYSRLWRATANGLEGLAALHNDGLLILDELSQIDPKEAGEAAYLLANGQGKTRASRVGTARQSARWRLLFLSSGEESLAALMARAGRKVNAGQEVRLAEIDADAGAGMGLFENLHGHPSPAAFALALKDAASRYHGTVGQAWLHHLVADRAKVAEFIADGIKGFVADVVPKDAAGQVLRVARRFGLVAMAGELASGCDLVGAGYGLTGWAEGEALDAAKRCFLAWLESFGGAGNREERAILAQVKAFFEAHGASRFAKLDDTFPDDQRIINRAGFVREAADGGREYLVLPEVFKREVCAGFDVKLAARALVEAGWIEPGKDGKTAQKPRLPGLGPTRCYVFTARMWDADE
jgi:uncharacterized protein (DUF927 family)